jgi:hypothetical protein
VSRLTESVFSDPAIRQRLGIDPDSDFDPLDPDNIAPAVAWLASAESREITGRVLGVRGGRICVAEGWNAGPAAEQDYRWDAATLGKVIPDLVGQAAPNAGQDGTVAR